MLNYIYHDIKVQIKNSDVWNRALSEGEGYIYNDFGTQFPGDSPTWNTTDFNKLHRISCPHVRRMKYVTEGKFTKYYFKTKNEAIEWLNSNRKIEGYTLCKFCNP